MKGELTLVLFLVFVFQTVLFLGQFQQCPNLLHPQKRHIVSKSGNVIVSDDNTVYLLNGDLSEVIQMDRNDGQSPEGMALTRDEGRI